MKHLLAAGLLVLILLFGGLAVYQLAAGGSRTTYASVPLTVFVLLLVAAYNRVQKKPAGPPASAKPVSMFAGPPVLPLHPVIHPPLRRAGPGRGSVPQGQTLTIDAVRGLLGNAPRTFDRSLGDYLRILPPPWLNPADDPQLGGLYARQDEIRAAGRVVWAAVVQANSLLFKPGPIDHPASVVYSPDPWFDAHPEALARVAANLFSLKHTDRQDPDEATFARILTNERTRAVGLKVPLRLAGGRAAYHSSLMFVRKHLPVGYITGNVMPVWVDPADGGTLLLVPAAYWSPKLLTWWHEDRSDDLG